MKYSYYDFVNLKIKKNMSQYRFVCFFITLLYATCGFPLETITLEENVSSDQNVGISSFGVDLETNNVSTLIQKNEIQVCSWDEISKSLKDDDQDLYSKLEKMLRLCTGEVKAKYNSDALKLIVEAIIQRYKDSDSVDGIFRIIILQTPHSSNKGHDAITRGTFMTGPALPSHVTSTSCLMRGYVHISNEQFYKKVKSSHLFRSERKYDEKYLKLKGSSTQKLLDGEELTRADINEECWETTCLSKVLEYAKEKVAVCCCFIPTSLPEIKCNYIIQHVGDDNHDSPAGIYSIENDENQCVKGNKSFPVYIYKDDVNNTESIKRNDDLCSMLQGLLENDDQSLYSKESLESMTNKILEDISEEEVKDVKQVLPDSTILHNKSNVFHRVQMNSHNIRLSNRGMFQITLKGEDKTILKGPIYVATKSAYEYTQREIYNNSNFAHKRKACSKYTARGMVSYKILSSYEHAENDIFLKALNKDLIYRLLSNQISDVDTNVWQSLVKPEQTTLSDCSPGLPKSTLQIRYIPFFVQDSDEFSELPVAESSLEKRELPFYKKLKKETPKVSTLDSTNGNLFKQNKTAQVFAPISFSQNTKDCQMLYKQLRGIVDYVELTPPVNFDNLTLSKLMNTLISDKYIPQKIVFRSNGSDCPRHFLYELIFCERNSKRVVYIQQVISEEHYTYLLSNSVCCEESLSVQECLKQTEGLFKLDVQNFESFLKVEDASVSLNAKKNIVWLPIGFLSAHNDPPSGLSIYMRCIEFFPIRLNENELHLYQSLGLTKKTLTESAFKSSLTDKNYHTEVLDYVTSREIYPFGINKDSKEEELELTYQAKKTESTEISDSDSPTQKQLLIELFRLCAKQNKVTSKYMVQRKDGNMERNNPQVFYDVIAWLAKQGLYLSSKKGLILRSKCCGRDIILTCCGKSRSDLGLFSAKYLITDEGYKDNEVIEMFHQADCETFKKKRYEEYKKKQDMLANINPIVGGADLNTYQEKREQKKQETREEYKEKCRLGFPGQKEQDELERTKLNLPKPQANSAKLHENSSYDNLGINHYIEVPDLPDDKVISTARYSSFKSQDLRKASFYPDRDPIPADLVFNCSVAFRQPQTYKESTVQLVLPKQMKELTTNMYNKDGCLTIEAQRCWNEHVFTVLAKNGFFTYGVKRIISCFSCGCKLTNFTDDDFYKMNSCERIPGFHIDKCSYYETEVLKNIKMKIEKAEEEK